MPSALPIRSDRDAAELRRLARRERRGRVSTRLLALANALDGLPREEGVEGLRDRHRPGRPCALDDGPQAALKALVLRGLGPETGRLRRLACPRSLRGRRTSLRRPLRRDRATAGSATASSPEATRPFVTPPVPPGTRCSPSPDGHARSLAIPGCQRSSPFRRIDIALPDDCLRRSAIGSCVADQGGMGAHADASSSSTRRRAAPADEAGFWPVISRPSGTTYEAPVGGLGVDPALAP